MLCPKFINFILILYICFVFSTNFSHDIELKNNVDNILNLKIQIFIFALKKGQ